MPDRGCSQQRVPHILLDSHHAFQIFCADAFFKFGLPVRNTLRFDHRLFSWVFVSGLVLAVLVYVAVLSTFRYWQDL